MIEEQVLPEQNITDVNSFQTSVLDKNFPKRELTETELDSYAQQALSWVKELKQFNPEAYHQIADDLRYRLLEFGIAEKPEKQHLQEWLIEEVQKAVPHTLKGNKTEIPQEALEEPKSMPGSSIDVIKESSLVMEPQTEAPLQRILTLLTSLRKIFEGKTATSRSFRGVSTGT